MGALTPPEEVNIDDLTKPVSEERINADISTMEMGLVVTQEGEEPKNVVELVKAGAFSHLKTIDINDKDTAEEVWGTMQALKKCRTTLGNVRLALTSPWEEYKKRLIKKEKDIVAVIEPEEKRLKAVYDKWEASVADRAAEEERKENARIQERVQKVLATGAVYNETSGSYILGDTQINATQVKVLTDAAFTEAIASMEQAAAVARKAEEDRKAKEQRFRERKALAFTIGAVYDGSQYAVVGSDMQITDDEMHSYSDPAWDAVTSSWRKAIQKAAEDAKAEQERKDKEAKEAADKLEAERKKKEEDDQRMKAVLEKLNKAIVKELVEVGWEQKGEALFLMRPDGAVHQEPMEILSTLSDEYVAELIALGKGVLADRQRIATLNERKNKMREIGFEFGGEVGSLLNENGEADYVWTNEYLLSLTEEEFVKHQDIWTAFAAKVKELREAKAREQAAYREANPDLPDFTKPIVPPEDLFPQHRHDVPKPQMQTQLVGRLQATMAEGAKVVGAEFVEDPKGDVRMTMPQTTPEALVEHYAQVGMTDAAADADRFERWAQYTEDNIPDDDWFKTETARAKFKAHKRYIDNVIEGIRKAAKEINPQP